MGNEKHGFEYEPIQTLKKCCRCQELKSLAAFHKDKHNKDGLCGTCKSCAIERSKNWYVNNKARSNANGAKNYAENKQSFNDRSKQWREKNAAQKAKKDKEYRENNKAAVRASKARRKAAKRSATKPYCPELLALVEL